jgi:hypothetical protein
MASHKGHAHAATPSARAACRALAGAVDRGLLDRNDYALRPQDDPNEPGRVLEFAPGVGIPTFTRTTELHCELCGTLDYEAIHGNDDNESAGYTACCNEPRCYGDSTVVWAWRDESTGTTGNIEACCAARITFPNDSIHITHRL